MEKNEKISIPAWLEDEVPVYAEFCKMINAALEHRPNISLAEFAGAVDMNIKKTAYERIKAVIQAQLDGRA